MLSSQNIRLQRMIEPGFTNQFCIVGVQQDSADHRSFQVEPPLPINGARVTQQTMG
jgi:hypothetical protein